MTTEEKLAVVALALGYCILTGFDPLAGLEAWIESQAQDALTPW
ncbi:hypothetical protein [Salarchaeum japonicum]|uniref:Uncharacterized protein n=1 Tax=Salarchaeum japonicum TaxID=555573 RepID=A0AAV3T0A3_9EURY|nr:hypothetical protein [Salarchaeum japonicum]